MGRGGARSHSDSGNSSARINSHLAQKTKASGCRPILANLSKANCRWHSVFSTGTILLCTGVNGTRCLSSCHFGILSVFSGWRWLVGRLCNRLSMSSGLLPATSAAGSCPAKCIPKFSVCHATGRCLLSNRTISVCPSTIRSSRFLVSAGIGMRKTAASGILPADLSGRTAADCPLPVPVGVGENRGS